MSSEKVRANILATGHPRWKSAQIEISATPAAIFAIISNPHRHQDFDGSNTIKANFSGPEKLSLGARFGMKMRLGINYQVTNVVLEYKENELLAWRHLGRWTWRYELSDLGNGITRVTESFDARKSPLISQLWLSARKAYPWTEKTIAKSLVRLKSVAENE
jgi:hypothetical protein